MSLHLSYFYFYGWSLVSTPCGSNLSFAHLLVGKVKVKQKVKGTTMWKKGEKLSTVFYYCFFLLSCCFLFSLFPTYYIILYYILYITLYCIITLYIVIITLILHKKVIYPPRFLIICPTNFAIRFISFSIVFGTICFRVFCSFVPQVILGLWTHFTGFPI